MGSSHFVESIRLVSSSQGPTAHNRLPRVLSMVAAKRKSKILNLRLSEEEYRALQDASLNNGARSLSDYARAVFRANGRGWADAVDDLNLMINRFEAEIDTLHTFVTRLQLRAEKAKGQTE